MFEVEKLYVTPDCAEKLLASNYEHQRAVRKNKVSFLAGEMKKGRFEPISPLLLTQQNGEKVLINGQHTLHAIIESNISQWLPVIYRGVESKQETARVFSRADRGLQRQVADSLEPFGLISETGLSKYNLTQVLAAIKWLKRGFTSVGKVPDIPVEDQMKWVEEWGDTAANMLDSIKYGEKIIRKKISNRAVLSVGLITTKHSPTEAQEFWSQVSIADRLSRHDPRKLLNDKLRVYYMRGGATTYGEQVKPEYLSRLVASAWNAFYNGDDRIKLVVRNNYAPMVLFGVPLEALIPTL